MNVLFLQYGDYAEAYRRFQAGEPETYRDQCYTVNFVASLAPDHQVIIVAACDRPHDEQLAPGVQSIGTMPAHLWDRKWLWLLLDRLAPDVLILRTPNLQALEWAAKNCIPTLPVFADFLGGNGVRYQWGKWRLSRALRRCSRPCVANHSLAASQSLRSLGLSPHEIVPWEFQRLQPLSEAKMPPPTDQPFRLFFAGMLIESKGVSDCIEAVAILKALGQQIELTLAGPGDTNQWAERAQKLGVGKQVHLAGLIPSDRVLTMMREHDAVVVPSRHDYAEGLPNTIFEALASRSPLIVSDHPAFTKRLQPGKAVMQFPAARPESLAEQIKSLIHDPKLYLRLSRESPSALDSLYVGIEWTKLITLFLEDPKNIRGWVQDYSLAAQKL